MVSLPHELDWVTERGNCSPAKVFQLIRLSVESDVKTRNKQLPEGSPQFQFAYHGNGSFVVFVKTSRIERTRTFEETEDGIRVVDDNAQKVVIEATLTLGDDGQCRLKTNDREFEFWQFRRTALESILFQPVH
jgi:hypothetical protein